METREFLMFSVGVEMKYLLKTDQFMFFTPVLNHSLNQN